VAALNDVERRQGVLLLELVGDRVSPLDNILTTRFQADEFLARRVLRSAHNLRDPKPGVEAQLQIGKI